MTDVGLMWKDGKADILLNSANNDLQVGHDLQTAVLNSLFTDARAPVADLPSLTDERRGWWSAELGSLLWLLQRSKATLPNLEKGITYIRNSLNWLLANDIASKIEVTGRIENLTKFAFQIKISKSTSAKYDYLWNDLATELFEFDRSSYLILFE